MDLYNDRENQGTVGTTRGQDRLTQSSVS